MQFVKHSPVPDSKAIAIASMKLGDVIVPGVRIDGYFLDFPHNPLLPVDRKPGKRFRKCLRGEDFVHCRIVTLSNSFVKQLLEREAVHTSLAPLEEIELWPNERKPPH